MQGVGEHHDEPYSADDAVVSDEKAGRDDLVDVETHVESAVQVYAKVTGTVDRLHVDIIDVDAYSSRLKT